MCVCLSMCVWVFSQSGCQHFWWGFPLSLSQSADVVWRAGLPPLLLTLTKNKNTGWRANSSPVWHTICTYGLAGRIKAQIYSETDLTQTDNTHTVLFINYTGVHVYLSVWSVQAHILCCVQTFCVDYDIICHPATWTRKVYFVLTGELSGHC